MMEAAAMEMLAESPLTIVCWGEGAGNPVDSVDQQNIRWYSQVFDRYRHGKKGGLQDVDPVDFRSIDNADTDGEGMITDVEKQQVSFFWAEFFGVGNAEFRKGFR